MANTKKPSERIGKIMLAISVRKITAWAARSKPLMKKRIKSNKAGMKRINEAMIQQKL